MNHRIVTRAIIHDDQGRVLLAKRANSSARGRWALIGGKPEGHETPEQTVTREVLEETGLTFRPKLFREETDSTSVPGEVWKVYYFVGTAEGVLELQAENSEARWIDPNELDTMDVAFGHAQIIQDARAAFRP